MEAVGAAGEVVGTPQHEYVASSEPDDESTQWVGMNCSVSELEWTANQ